MLLSRVILCRSTHDVHPSPLSLDPCPSSNKRVMPTGLSDESGFQENKDVRELSIVVVDVKVRCE